MAQVVTEPNGLNKVAVEAERAAYVARDACRQLNMEPRRERSSLLRNENTWVLPA